MQELIVAKAISISKAIAEDIESKKFEAAERKTADLVGFLFTSKDTGNVLSLLQAALMYSTEYVAGLMKRFEVSDEEFERFSKLFHDAADILSISLLQSDVQRSYCAIMDLLAGVSGLGYEIAYAGKDKSEKVNE